MTFLTSARTAYERHGITHTLRKAIPHLHREHIRPRLPRRQTERNGVPVRSKRSFDGLTPWQTGHPDVANYESGIINTLRKHVNSGDTITIVGGGWGITTTVAAEETGETGEVRTFEASPEYSEYVEETAELNGVGGRVEVTPAVVSESISSRGSQDSPRILSPGDLPTCDVLELDCEGAELSILEGLAIQPRVIIVESHGHLGASSGEVVDRLESLSYQIESVEPAEQGVQESTCRDNDIQVITAVEE